MFYSELTTVKDVRESFLGGTGSGDDALILDFIRAASREMGDLAGGRRFAPRIEARVFDMPRDRLLMLDDDLLAVNALTNGDGTSISPSAYDLLSANFYPKWGVKLKLSSSIWWVPSSAGDTAQVISVNGVWGFHRDYADAWQLSGAELTGDINSTVTTLAVTNGILKAGQLVKIDSEYLYVVAASGASATVVRGVNGSTPATHVTATSIYVWTPEPEISHTARLAAAAYYRLRTNPLGDTVQIDDETFATPKDVLQFIKKRVEALGVKRL